MLKVNDEVKVKCIGINNYAKGVAKLDSLLIFVDNMYEDEEAIVTITKLEKNLAYANIKELTLKAPYRIEPVCHHSSDSGTCPFNNITYEAECDIKKNLVLNNINHALNLNIDDLKFLPSPILKGYRNKVTVFFTNLDNEYSFGYFKEDSHDFVKVEDCILIDDDILNAINTLLLLLKEKEIPLYDFNKNEGEVKGVSIRKSSYTGKMSLMVLTTKKDDFFEEISKKLVKMIPNISGISLSVNKKTDTIVYSGIEYQYYGDSYIDESILNTIFKINNQSFLQVNTKGAELLYSEAIKMASLKESDVVLDLYCGCGGISLNLAKYSKEVIGIELSKNSIHLARINAANNKVKNVAFYSLDAKDYNNVIKNKKINKVFLDPPRLGLSKEIIDALIKSRFEMIIYVSCDPYTLARDLKTLTTIYNIREIKAVDMFPRTKHVESLVLLSLKHSSVSNNLKLTGEDIDLLREQNNEINHKNTCDTNIDGA